MDTGRFHRAVHLLAHAMEQVGLEEKLRQLVSDLTQLSANPNPQYAEQFRNHLEELRTDLLGTSIDFSKGEGSEIFSRLIIGEYWGEGLFERLKRTIEENQLSPALAAAAITKLTEEVMGVLSAIRTINQLFDKLPVDYTFVDDGNSEMVLDLPVEFDTKTLEDLSKEAKEWSRIVSPIVETFDPERTPATISTLATGSWLIYLSTSAAALFGMAMCMKGVNAILLEAIKTRGLYRQLVEVKAPVEVLTGLEAHSAEKVTTDLNALATKLVNEHYKGQDDGRRNELRTSLAIALQKLAKKLTEGAKVDLRLTPPKKPKIEPGIQPTPDEQKMFAQIASVENMKGEIDSAPRRLEITDVEDVGNLLSPPGGTGVREE